MKKGITQMGLVKEFFTKNPNRNIKHPEVVDWVVADYQIRQRLTLKQMDCIHKFSDMGKN